MKTIYSVGHSVKKWEVFLKELEDINFDYLVDVRSVPYSRFNPQFNKNRLINQLGEKYLFKGDSLGGRDENISEENFEQGVDELLELAEDKIVVYFCSEKDYKKCHRYYKIAPALFCKGYFVIHL